MLPSYFCRVHFQNANLARRCSGAKFIRMGKQAHKSYDYFKACADLDKKRRQRVIDLNHAKSMLEFYKKEVKRLS